MTIRFGEWTLGLEGGEPPARELIGGKAWSVARMSALGLRTPPAFVVTTRACAAYLSGGYLPHGLEDEISAGVAWLESATRRQFGRGPSPLLVSVRSGAPISMPGMMDTVLNLGINEATEAHLSAECGDPAFARDVHRRFLDLYGRIVLKTGDIELRPDRGPADWCAELAAAAGAPVPTDVVEQLRTAVRAVFESWNSRRARRYRQHHGIADGLGTAVTVQTMVFGNFDECSGTGVLFTRNPLTGEAAPYGEYLARAQGEDVVSGRFTPRPLSAMAESLPEAHDALLTAARQLERAARDVQDIEFTIDRGRLYFLQSRAAKLSPGAAVRIAVDLVRESVIDEAEALRRVTPEQVQLLLSPHLGEDTIRDAKLLASGEGASPGVGVGIVVDNSDEAERRARGGEAVVLMRATTSPEDLHGMIAARAVATEQGGSTSHAAVVGRALGLPCAVGCGVGALAGLTGRVVTVDGRLGKVFEGALPVEKPDENDNALLLTLTRWASERSPLRVLSPRAPEARDAFDLGEIDAAADPERIGEVLASLKSARGARGGAVASAEGVRAAIAAGLEFIVADPVLPPLLRAARLASETVPAPKEKQPQ
jgi:pyruvate,orthophosphate dikinase